MFGWLAIKSIWFRLHAWGSTLQEAFEQCGVAMFGYMTELETVELKQCYKITASGDDIESLLFHFLDELLFLFSAEPFLTCAKLEISKFDLVDFEIDCLCYGEPFQLGKHPQGTEVKAITYSAMQVIQKPTKNEVYVIIDIWVWSDFRQCLDFFLHRFESCVFFKL